MSSVVVVSGSPFHTSKTAQLADLVASRLEGAVHLRLRDLPTVALLSADTSDPPIAHAIDMVADADGIVLVTPIYKASYSGLLKVFLDVLPQHGFTDKTVLPLAVGGTIAHLLAIDYGLRPVLQSMAPRHVLRSHFLLEQHLGFDSSGTLTLAPHIEDAFAGVVENFRDALMMSMSYVGSARA
jgi:FMN reductase